MQDEIWHLFSGVAPLAPGKFSFNLNLVIFKLISSKDILSISCEIALKCMPQDLTDDYRQTSNISISILKCWSLRCN